MQLLAFGDKPACATPFQHRLRSCYRFLSAGFIGLLVRRITLEVRSGLKNRNLGSWSLKERPVSPQSPPNFRGNSLLERLSLVFATRGGQEVLRLLTEGL